MGRRPHTLPVKPLIDDKLVPTQMYLILFKSPEDKPNYPPRAFAYVRPEERESKLAFLRGHGFKCITKEYKLAK